MIQDAQRNIVYLACLLLIATSSHRTDAAENDRLIRSREPDRGTYQPPVIAKRAPSRPEISTTGTDRGPATHGLVDAPLDEPSGGANEIQDESGTSGLPAPVILAETPKRTNPLQSPAIQTVAYTHTAPSAHAVAHASADHHHITPGTGIATCSCESCQSASAPQEFYQSPDMMGTEVYASGSGGSYCDESQYCDSIGSFRGPCSPWFGSIDLLLMFRQGDHLPALASDGELDDNTTQIFAGRETIYQDITAGGRLQIGAWLDNYRDRNLVARGWFAGEQSYGFDANQTTHPTLARPFLNVTDGTVPPIQDTRIIASPGESTGALSIHGDSNTYGGDISIRQLWCKSHGATIDLLYGYQYMGLDESLLIADRSVSIADGVRPIGSVLATTDSFDIENDFHGGQIGVASHYREGCWSFSSLAKVGFGSIRRRATLAGSTFTSIDGNNATNPNGLLVRSTNSGTHSDDTFGWAPELDFTLGWQRFPSFDITFGYHIMAMTDALRVGGTIDPNLASNLASDPVGAQRPSADFRYGTFYVQGIHFGLAYIY